jgi:hypothetical protein
MTFTYEPSATADDVTLVRYYISDTVRETAMYSDEEITMIVARKGTVGAAAQSLLEGKIRELSNNPNMQADWLRVDWSTTLEALKTALAAVKSEFGLGWQSSSGGQHSYRPDTLLKEAPDYGEE